MSYRYYIWIFPLLIFTTVVHAVDMDEECINEPVFNGIVCLYQANRDYTDSIFLIHGIGDNASRDWDMQLSELAKYYRIITIDLPGFGRSEKGDKLYSPEKYVELINFVAAYYAIERFDLVGHSMGAAVSILYASRFPENVRRLVVVDTAGILHRLAIGKYVIARALNGNGNGTNRTESYVVKLIEKFERYFSLNSNEIAKNDERIRAGIELVKYNFGNTLDKLDTPTLIIWGEADSIAPMRTAKVLAHRIKNSQLKIIKGAGHLPMRDQPHQFNDLLVNYLQYPEVISSSVKRTVDSVNNKYALCKGERGVKFSGNYHRIEVRNCSGVNIKDANIDELYVFESRVVIDGSRIGGDVPIAIQSIGSDIKITASKIIGDVAITADRSRFDMAAVDIHLKESAVLGISKSRIIYSVCRIFNGAGAYSIHNSVTLKAGEIL